MKQRGICVLVSCLGFCSQASGQGGIITTVAGNGGAGFSGDGGPATSASLWSPYRVAVDASGNLFVTDRVNNRIRKVSPSGIITTIAGQGSLGFAGDGGPATTASLFSPEGVAVDASGNIFIADAGNGRIRKVSLSGIITTVAGNGTNVLGDGGLATSASLSDPADVAVDASGNIFIADAGNRRIRKVLPSGIITTVAGNGTNVLGDGGPATSASLSSPSGVAVDASGNIFIADFYDQRIRKVSASGIITTVAGSISCAPALNTCGRFSSDGGPAASAELYQPTGVAVDASGNLFIADSGSNRIRKVAASGIITTVAGNGTAGFSGDGGPATSASLNGPASVAVDGSGNLFIADNNRIREVSASTPPAGADTIITGTIQFTGGTCFSSICSAVGLLPTAGSFTYDQSASQFTSFTVTYDGVIYDFVNDKTYAPANNPQVSGSEPCLSGATGGAATFALLTSCPGVWFANSSPGSSLFDFYLGPAVLTIAQSSTGPLPVSGGNYTVSVSQHGTLASITVTPAVLNFQTQLSAPPQSQSLQIGGTAGTVWQATAATSSGGAWLSVSPGAGQIPASLTALVNSSGLTAGTYQGSITIQAPGATPSSSTISVTLTVTGASGQAGIITTVAGNGSCCFSGDGGQATSASLASPNSVAVDASGNLYIADISNRVRKVSPSGIITTVAGNGTQGFSGDGGPAISASLNEPYGLAVDASGNLYISDLANNRIRKITPGGTISTIAGIGPSCPASGPPCGGFSGDGGKATSAALNNPRGVALDASGNFYIADTDNSRIRKVSPAGIITTVAGDGNTYTCTPASCSPFYGDGGQATSAGLLFPEGVAVDASGNLYIADTVNERVRKVSANGIITTVAGNGAQSSSGDGGAAISAAVQPYSVAVDALGNLFIADYADNVVRKVSPAGIITTFAGNGKSGFSGDGGPATLASVNAASVALDTSGNLFIADFGNGRVREVMAAASTTELSISATNDASFTTSISPGSLVALFGNGNILANSTGSGFSAPLPTSSGGTSVTMNGLACPLVYVSPTQINLEAPTALSAGTATVVVNNNGKTFSTTVQVLTAAPGIFTSDYMVTAILQDGNGAVLDQNNPASPGETVALYLTGIGPVTNYSGDGEPAPFGPLAQSTSSYTLAVNGTAAHIDYLGLTPGLVGVGQINFEIPAGTPAGNTIPVVLTIAGTVSKTVQISVKATASTPQIQSLTLSPNSVASGGTVTGTIVLSSAAPSGGAVVTFSSSSSGASVPALVTVPAGATSATFTVSAGAVSSNQTVTITASYGGSSAQASLAVGPPPNSQCTNISGNWNASESGSYTTTIVAPIESDSFTDPISGSGSTTITQTGCSIQYDPVGESGLIGTNLTPSQLASLVRTGTVSGNNVSITGILALVDAVSAAESGLTITKISTNVVNGSGQVSGNVMTLNETGTFAASGTYSISGQTGSFTLTITSSSSATFNWASGTRPADEAPKTVLPSGADSTSAVEVRVMHVRASSSRVGQGDIPALLRAALKEALVFGVR